MKENHFERWETNKVSPTIVPAYSLRKISSQGTSRVIQVDSVSFSKLRRQSWEPGVRV